MKKTIFLAFIFYVQIFYSMGVELHSLYQSFLTTKVCMHEYVNLCQKASDRPENQEIEKYLNRSLEKFLSNSLPNIKNQLVIDFLSQNLNQNGWRAVQECSSRVERTEESMLLLLSYNQQTIKCLVAGITKDFKQNLTVLAKNDQREDVVKFIQANL